MAEAVVDKIEASVEARKLTGHDRCDQCVGQAYVLVQGLTGELTFCGHHFSKIEKNDTAYNKLKSFAYSVQDEREGVSDKRAGL
jgi:hypothetical protein